MLHKHLQLRLCLMTAVTVRTRRLLAVNIRALEAVVYIYIYSIPTSKPYYKVQACIRTLQERESVHTPPSVSDSPRANGTYNCGACSFAGFFWFMPRLRRRRCIQQSTGNLSKQLLQQNFNFLDFCVPPKCLLQLGTKCAAALSPDQLCKQDLAGCRDHHLQLLRHYLILARISLLPALQPYLAGLARLRRPREAQMQSPLTGIPGWQRSSRCQRTRMTPR